MDDTDIRQAKTLLSQLKPGYLPEPLFQEITRLSVSGILELVPLRKNPDGLIEVLVLRRDESDPHWPGMLHTPGTLLRPTDSDDFTTALARVFSEVNRDSNNYSVEKVDTVFHTVKRGKELSVVFATNISDVKETDIWLPLREIENKIVDTQISFVKKSAEILFA